MVKSKSLLQLFITCIEIQIVHLLSDTAVLSLRFNFNDIAYHLSKQVQMSKEYNFLNYLGT